LHGPTPGDSCLSKERQVTINPEGMIPIIGGSLAWLMATGRYNPSKDPVKWEEWLRRWGPMLKILTPLVILFGIAQLLGFLGKIQ
jgi:hypothetical protein